MKTYLVEIINSESANQPSKFSGFDARLCLSAAMKFAESHVKKGENVRVLCENEVIWEGNFMEEIIKFIKQYAQDHYNDGGWDVIVECWGDSDIRDYLNSCKITTQAEALKQFKRVVGVWADQQADAKNSAF